MSSSLDKDNGLFLSDLEEAGGDGKFFFGAILPFHGKLRFPKGVPERLMVCKDCHVHADSRDLYGFRSALPEA